MNPGYLGRSELPEGLKALFRPITVMVPDFKLIMENMFMGEGFTEAKALGLKFSTLYALNKDLLSQSKKYDWGMRAIKSVLVVAGGFKRADPSLSEQAVLMRSLRDTNVAKIEGDDLRIFMALLKDLFPGIDVPRARDYEMEEQLFVFLYTRRGEKTTTVDFSPKAISTNELYGFVNMQTREWKDGIISKVMRDLGQVPDTHPKWIMLDGDLDANWIESMNSVMDDNRLLTLPSNERIPLKVHMKMIFEIRDLNYATPATATRAGIVCMDDTFGVQWRSYVKSNWWKGEMKTVKYPSKGGIFDYYVKDAKFEEWSTAVETLEYSSETPMGEITAPAGKLYAPPGKLQLIYFVDDLNMPALDKYNTQSAIELMKQKQDYGHWYDRQKILIKDIGNTQYLCCMNPTAGSFIVNQRLQRHFWTCAVPFPEQSALLTIYSTFMKGHFERLPFKGPVQEQVSGIIKAALSLHSMVVSSFRKTASNFHYEFNIRHMSGVFSGLLQAKPGEFADAEKVVLLWIHESERIYGDRLVSPTDLKKYRALAADLSKKMFGTLGNFMTVQRRFAYTTPKSFLELIKLYTSMVGQKVDALEDQKDRLTSGLEKLRATSEQVAGLEEELKEKAVVVAEKAAAADVFATEVGEKKATVQEESAKAAVEAEKCAKIAKDVSIQQADCEKDLAAAIPLVEQAEACFIDDGKVPQANVEKARKIQTAMGDDFSQAGMSKKSSAAAGLCVWIINIIMYYDVVVQVEPKRNALREATETLNAANTKLAEVKELVQTLETNLAALMKEFDKAMAEKNALMADAEKCQNKLNMAQRHSMLSTFEMSLDQGKPVLIENMGEGIDAVIMPVVSRNTIKRGNKRFVKLGDKEIVLNDSSAKGAVHHKNSTSASIPKTLSPVHMCVTKGHHGLKGQLGQRRSSSASGAKNSFKLFMQTKLSNPHYPPEVQAECTIINFTVTEDGLEDQLLFLVVKLERQMRKKAELIKQQNEFKVTLAHLEALLLEKLANAEGDILDDTELILSLEEAKKTSDEVKEKVVVAQARSDRSPRRSLLFFQLMSLCNMHTFYKYSLDAYLMVVTRAVNSVTLRKPKERQWCLMV
eukprot:g9260.t1